MKTKLTLTIEREAVAKAKRLARQRGVSVSALFEQWSRTVAETEEGRPPLGARLRGRWKAAGNAMGDSRFDYLLEKHGRR